MHLEGKRILVTGGGSGIGLELALRLAERNRVVIAGRPGDVADAIVRGLRRDREEIRVAQVRQLVPPARILPNLADRLVTRALTARGGPT